MWIRRGKIFTQSILVFDVTYTRRGEAHNTSQAGARAGVGVLGERPDWLASVFWRSYWL